MRPLRGRSFLCALFYMRLTPPGSRMMSPKCVESMDDNIYYGCHFWVYGFAKFASMFALTIKLYDLSEVI